MNYIIKQGNKKRHIKAESPHHAMLELFPHEGPSERFHLIRYLPDGTFIYAVHGQEKATLTKSHG